MALPTLTPEQRAEALEKAAAARTARRALLDEVRGGRASIASVLARSAIDPIVAKTKVEALIRAVPGYGPARATELLNKVGIAENRRVAGLGAKQIAALISEMS
jgi:hypothetical protein